MMDSGQHNVTLIVVCAVGPSIEELRQPDIPGPQCDACPEESADIRHSHPE